MHRGELNDCDETLGFMEGHHDGGWSQLKESDASCDATLRTDDGAEYRIHRDIMSACSPYFQVLFTTQMHDAPVVHQELKGVGGDMLRLVVRYAYTHVAHVTEDNVAALLPVADRLCMLGMLRECCDFLREHMTPDNCLGIRQFARNYFCHELAETADNFLSSRFGEVCLGDEYLELPPGELLSLLDSELLNVSNEEVVWEAAVRWVDHDPQARKPHVVDLLGCVRLGLLDTRYFMERVKTHEYVDSVESCKPLVIETLKFLYDLEMIGMKTVAMETPLLARPRIPYEILFTVGGWSGGNPTDLVETYDTRADRWIRVNEVDSAGARAYHKCAVIGYNIYVIGGFNGNDYFNSCRCFNAVSKTWSEMAPMNIRRCYVSVAVLNGVIYALGGYDGQHRHNTAERYDPSFNQWSLIGPMNVQRSDACATALDGFVYIVGGFNGTECLNSGERFDPRTGLWSAIASMRQRRSGVSAVGHRGRLYALGGFNGISRLVSGERYDPATNQWAPVPDMFNPRSNFAVEVMDDMIFAIGGFNGATTIFHVECYDERTAEWYEATDMNAARSALAACVVPALPNVRDFVHQNREQLMEEKRQKLRQQQQAAADGPPTRGLLLVPPREEDVVDLRDEDEEEEDVLPMMQD